MNFKEAAESLDLINCWKPGKVNSNFVLTKSNLKKKLSKQIVLVHPESPQYKKEYNSSSSSSSSDNSTSTSSATKECYQQFWKVLQAHRYLRKCLSNTSPNYNHKNPITTCAEAATVEQRDPVWDTKVDDDDEYRADMGTVAYKIQQRGWDTTEITNFMMEEVCGGTTTTTTTILGSHGQPVSGSSSTFSTTNGSNNNERIITCDDIVEFLSHTSVQALIEGIQYWKKLSPDNMALYLSAHDSGTDPSSFWDETKECMDTTKMIYTCMATYAPLINKQCYVTELSTPTWNDRIVRTVDYKKVNNVGKYTIEWNGATVGGSLDSVPTASTTTKPSYAVIKPGNLIPLHDDDDDDDDNDDDDDGETTSNKIKNTPSSNAPCCGSSRKSRKKKKKKKKKNKNLNDNNDDEDDDENPFTPIMIITEDGGIELRYPMERMSIGNLIFTNKCTVGVQRNKTGEFNLNFVLPSLASSSSNGDDIHGQFPIRPDDPCVEEYAVSIRPPNTCSAPVKTIDQYQGIINPCFIYLYINLKHPMAKQSAFVKTLYANYPQFNKDNSNNNKKMAKQQHRLTVVLEPKDSKVLESLLELLLVTDIPPVPKSPANLLDIASALVKHSMKNNGISNINSNTTSEITVNTATNNTKMKQKEFLQSGLQQLKQSSSSTSPNNNPPPPLVSRDGEHLLRFKKAKKNDDDDNDDDNDGYNDDDDDDDDDDIHELDDLPPLTSSCQLGTCSDCGGVIESPPQKVASPYITPWETGLVNSWTSDQDKQLQKGLQMFPRSMERNIRWNNIATEVNGKSMKECVARVKVIKNALKAALIVDDDDVNDDADTDEEDLPPLVSIKEMVPDSDKSHTKSSNSSGDGKASTSLPGSTSSLSVLDAEADRVLTGENVNIHGLVSRSDLNGMTGIFKGHATTTNEDEARYKIQVMVQQKHTNSVGTTWKQLFLLKKENFRFDDEDLFSDSQPPSLVSSTMKIPEEKSSLGFDDENDPPLNSFKINSNENSLFVPLQQLLDRTKESSKKKTVSNEKKDNEESTEDKFLRLQKDLEEKDQHGTATRLIYQTFTPEEQEALAKLQGTDVTTIQNNLKQNNEITKVGENPDVGPRQILATFKIPKNKKPGDVIEVVNPHVVGQKLKVTIPIGTKPKKGRKKKERGREHFSVLVPLPELKQEVVPTCCVCTKVLPKEEDDPDNHIRAPLRVCEHVCCKICHGLIAGKLCPKCKSPVPKLDTFKLLPYVQHLDNSDLIIGAMLDEYFLYKESLRDEKDKALMEALEEAGVKTTKAVDKHYRRASLKVHPDRFGDEFREQFDRLTKARNVLRDEKLRRNYMDEMTIVACKADLGLIPQSHSLWIEKNDPDKKDQSRPEAQKQEAGKKKATLRIDGGLLNSKPKRPVVNIRQHNHMINIYMPITNRHQFEKYAQKISIYGSCGNLNEEEVVLKDIVIHNDPTSKFTMDEGGISTTVELSEGIWDVFWSITVSYDNGENEFETPKSSEARVDFRSGEQQKMLAQLSGLKAWASHRSVLLRSIIKSRIPTDRQQIEERHNELHHIIVKAIDIKKKLQQALRIANEKTCPSLDVLETAIRDAQSEKERFEGAVGKYEKRDVRKQFRRFLAAKLECGLGEELISTITREDLAAAGGDTNRLYQLLIEGKKSSSLAFNESVIVAAENREDLFTPKQRETLRDKIMTIAEASAKELEQIMAEEEKQKKVDVERRLLEERVKAIGFGRGQCVLIHDLASRADLNGSTAYYMGLGEDDRYIVKLAISGNEISLKKENFSVWDESKVQALAMKEPTFPAQVSAKASKPVRAPAPVATKSNVVPATLERRRSSTHNVHEKVCRICLEDSESETMISPCDCKGSSEWVHDQCLDEWRAKNGDSKTCGECLVEYNLKPKLTTAGSAAAAATETFKLVDSDTSTFTEVVTKKAEPKRISVVQPSTTPFVYTKRRRCYHERNCFHLQKSPDGCSFLHTKEEILFHHPNYRGPVPCEINEAKTATQNFTSDATNNNSDSFTAKTETTASETASSALDVYSQEMTIQSGSVGHVLGKNHKNLIRMMNETDARIKLLKKNANGSVAFKVSSTLTQKVDAAMKLMFDAANHSGGYTAPPSPVKPAVVPSTVKPTEVPKPPPNAWAPASAPAFLTAASSPSATVVAENAPSLSPSPPLSSSNNNFARPVASSQLQTAATNPGKFLNANDNSRINVNNNIGSNNNYYNSGINNTATSPSYQTTMTQEDSNSILSGLTGDGDSFLDHSSAIAIGGAGILGPMSDYNAIGVQPILPPFSSLHQPNQQLQRQQPQQHNLGFPPSLSQQLAPVVTPEVIPEGTIGPLSQPVVPDPSSYFLPSLLLTPQPILPQSQAPQVILPSTPALAQAPPPPPPGLPSVASFSANTANDNISSDGTINNATTVLVEDDEGYNDDTDHALLDFLVMKKDCFKVMPHDFHSWLVEQDIISMDDLIEACEDEDFVTDEMRIGGLKAFKKKGFIKAVSSYCDDSNPLYEV